MNLKAGESARSKMLNTNRKVEDKVKIIKNIKHVEYAKDKVIDEIQNVCTERCIQGTMDQTVCLSVYTAAKQGHLDCVKRLIECGADVNVMEKDGLSPLMAAARMGYSSVVQVLLLAGANANVVNDKKETALHYACGSNSRACLGHILFVGVDVNAQDQQGSTALILATKLNDPASIVALLNAGAKVNLKDNVGRTALHWAVFMGYVECTEILVRDGKADMEVVDGQGASPFVIAIKYNFPQIVQLLIDLGCDRNSIDGLMGTSLALAALKGHAEVIEVLVKNYEDPDEYGYFGMTPLMLATFESHVGAVEALIHAGADVGMQSRMGGSALHKSLIKISSENEERRHRILAKILRGNVDVNIRLTAAGYFTSCTNGKNCPLSFAITYGYVSLVRMLLIAGCNVSQTEISEWMELNNIRRFFNFSQLLNPILEWKSEPRSLMHSCRTAIRRCLPRRHAELSVTKLPIAESLKRYINYSEFDDVKIERAEMPDEISQGLIQQLQVTPCGMRALEGTLLHHTITENTAA